MVTMKKRLLALGVAAGLLMGCLPGALGAEENETQKLENTYTNVEEATGAIPGGAESTSTNVEAEILTRGEARDILLSAADDYAALTPEELLQGDENGELHLDRELTRAEYARLLDAARQQGRERLALLMETICATGIRVSELRYITLAAVRLGRAEIALKGKLRTILLPAKLCRKLQAYARKHAIASGELFLTARGKPLGRRQIWGEMKGLCPLAGVEKSKVFPHNLRHLFATTFYQSCKDIARLADVLGHSSIETTRVYLLTTGREHRRALDRLGLVS